MNPIAEKKTTKKADKGKKELQEELGVTQDKLMRLMAEFDNYQKRTSEELQAGYSRGVSDSLKEFVNVFDNFELALKNAPASEFKKGIEMIFAKFISTAEDLGLERINTEGEKFDPNLHEALLTEESDEESHTILEELQAGYLAKGKIIRTAKVKVAK